MKYLLIALLLPLTVCGQNSALKKFSWLLATWKLDGKEAYEKWIVVNDTMLGGLGYEYEYEEDEDETEMTMEESMRLVARKGRLFYIASVADQNEGKAVEFKITSSSKTSFTAQNPHHDFPSHIVYALLDERHLQVHIEGIENGKKKRVDFHFVKQD